jgi:hypothetical protein
LDAPNDTQGSARAAYVRRMCVGILAPAPLGTVLVTVILNGLNTQRLDRDALLGIPLAIIGGSLYAYLLVGAQSIAYAVLMEHVINRRVRSDTRAAASSAFLGAIAGALAALLFPRSELWSLGALLAIGSAVGFAVGHVLRRMYKAANSALSTDASRTALRASYDAAKRER